jgi:hypothetical protein
LVYGLITSCGKSNRSDSTPSPPPIQSYPANSRPEAKFQSRPKQSFDEPIAKFPDHGSVITLTAQEPIAPFEVLTKSGQNFLIKLSDAKTGKSVLKLYVVGGEPAKIKVPLGSYEVKFASGETWYGDEFLFGPETRYAKCDKQLSFTSGTLEEILALADASIDLDDANEAIQAFLLKNKFSAKLIDYVFNNRNSKTGLVGIDRLDSRWWETKVLPAIKNPRTHNELVDLLNVRFKAARKYYSLQAAPETISGHRVSLCRVSDGNSREVSISPEEFNENQADP